MIFLTELKERNSDLDFLMVYMEQLYFLCLNYDGKYGVVHRILNE